MIESIMVTYYECRLCVSLMILVSEQLVSTLSMFKLARTRPMANLPMDDVVFKNKLTFDKNNILTVL